MKSLKKITINKKTVKFPIFLPDATRAVVRSLSSTDLEDVGIEGVVVNTFHLMTTPGITLIDKAGGIKNFMSWNHFVVSDSGGFQLLTLVYNNRAYNDVSSEGIIFTMNNKRHKFTPEKSIQIQFKLKTDLMICLDDFTPPNANEELTNLTVDRTIEWARRCKEEFNKQVEKRKLSGDKRPLLFAVIQGGTNSKARERCAKGLLEIGFDGYGLGGRPLDDEGNLDVEKAQHIANLSPSNSPRFALGVGNPKALVECFKLGYNLFDCVLPTRDARHRRLYVFSKDPQKIDLLNEKNFTQYVHIDKERYARDFSPISQYCNCYTCKNYSKAYLHHLFKIGDALAFKLASIHNLKTYVKMVELLRKKCEN